MKKRNLLLISLLSLCLAACGGKESETSTPTEPVVSDTQPGGDKTETLPPVSDETDTEKETTTEPDIYDTLWSAELVDLMVAHLNGNVIPYIDLGKGVTGAYFPEEELGVLKIDGGTFDASLLDEFLITYQDQGWVAEVKSSKMTASFEAEHLRIEVLNNSGFFQVKAYYDEPFDPASVTDWDDSTKRAMQKNLHNHVLPYIYLGSSKILTDWSYTGDFFYMYGGKWNDQIPMLALTELNKAGWTNELVEEEGKYNLNSTYTFEDGCSLISSLKISTYHGVEQALWLLMFDEHYDKNDFTEWPDSVTQYFGPRFDGKEFPVLYLGTTNLSHVDYYPTGNCLTILGGDYQEEILADAKVTLTEAGFEEVTDGPLIYDEPSLTARKTFSDGTKFYAYLTKYNSFPVPKIELDIFYEQPYSDPGDVTSWSADIIQAFHNAFGTEEDHILPYFYVGNVTPSIENGNLFLRSDSYARQMFDIADSALKADGWDTEITYSTWSMDPILTAYKTMSDGCEMSCSISINAKTRKLEIEVFEAFIPENVAQEWPTNVKNALNNKFPGLDLPFVYLGSDTLTTETDPDGSFLITGDLWSNRVFDLAKEAFAADTAHTWTIAKDNGTILTFTTPIPDTANEYQVTFKQNYWTGAPQISIRKDTQFIVPERTEWNQSITNLMNNNFENHTIPYLYLKESNPDTLTGSYNSTKKMLTINGGTYDDRIKENAEQVLTANGYTVGHQGTWTDENALFAYIKNADGSHIRLIIDKTGYSPFKARLNIMYDPAGTIDETGEFTTEQTTSIQDSLGGNTLPYINMAGEITVDKDEDANVLYIHSTPTSYDNNYLYAAADKYKSEGYTVDLKPLENYDACGYYAPGFNAEKVLANGDRIMVQCYYDSSDGNNEMDLYAYIIPDYESHIPTPAEWSDSLTASISSVIGTTIPYVYLNTETPSFTDYEDGSCRLFGGIWDEKIIEKAKEAFEADAAHTWHITVTLDDYYKTHSLTATTTVGEQTLTVTIEAYWRYSYYFNAVMRISLE